MKFNDVLTEEMYARGDKKLHLRRADLKGADLSKANLIAADLRDANLRGANLRRADLCYSDLRCANLTDADLTNANLRFICHGNGKEIRTIEIPPYQVVLSNNIVAIGCRQYSISKWAGFSDRVIYWMDTDALEWWRSNRDTIFKMSTDSTYFTLG